MAEKMMNQKVGNTDEAVAAIADGVHNYSKSTDYIEPASPIKEKLEEFQDMKLGFMMHWGLYAQLGLIASWGLIDGKNWSRAKNEYGDRPYWYDDSKTLREEYFGLVNSFNPVRFNPDEWAQLAADNGFKYLLFTTKHHDGFCMWDTKQTDFKVTADNCPFSRHEKADIVKHVFEAFRKKDMMIGAYFSKPDWHCEHYWEPEAVDTIPTSSKPTYNIDEKPEKWQAFASYTHKQLEELIRDYGKIDILWLDGAVELVHDGEEIMIGEAINIGETIDRLREINPELIVADRLGVKEYENYLTPEQKIPEKVISVPWESCMTLGKDFHYVYDDDYKSPSQLIATLLEIVCKGGNLALNVSPQPDGRIPRNAIKSIQGLGEWLKKYGEAIYKTRPCAPFKEDCIFFTQTQDCIYAIAQEFTGTFIPCTQKVYKVEFLNDSCVVEFEEAEGGIVLKKTPETTEEYSVFKLYKCKEC